MQTNCARLAQLLFARCTVKKADVCKIMPLSPRTAQGQKRPPACGTRAALLGSGLLFLLLFLLLAQLPDALFLALDVGPRPAEAFIGLAPAGVGKVMLAHVASAQGEVAAENALGENAVYNGATNPSCVYTDPEFAGVGLTEEKAKEMGIAYQVGKFPLMANGKSLIMNGGVGSIKFIIGTEYKEVLGVHILGPRATDLIGECALAIGMEATVEDIIAAIHAHPTVTEAVREAALAAEKRAIHIPNK